jgi:DNA-directed RNA polymerase specialized sigma24 family protein
MYEGTLDKALASKVLGGDKEAEENFYGLFRHQLHSTAAFYLGPEQSEAGNLVHETFLSAMPLLKDFDFQVPLQVWLRQICVRHCFNRLSRHKPLQEGGKR